MFEEISYERPLVIGTGGGNDIVSACFIVADLRKHGKQADLAGICSPAAWHTYDGDAEKPVNAVTDTAARHIPSKTAKPISFIDAKVPQLLREQGLDVNVYNLSCRYGTSNLIEDLEKLIREQKYDGVIAVDVGGDILARTQDNTILSPLMDFSTLYVTSKLSVPPTLIEFGLQTDGELRPQSCKEIIDELAVNKTLLGTKMIDSSDPAVAVYRTIYKGIEHIRHGHTAAMTLQTFEAKEDIHTEYRFRLQVLDKKWYHSFPIVLESKYFAKAFIIDLQALAKTRPLAFSYQTPLESCLKTKKIVDTETEMDSLYSWVNGTCVWLGLLSPKIQDDQRREILQYGLDNLEAHADVALLWQKDEELIPRAWDKGCIDDLVVVGKSIKHVSRVAIETERIKSRFHLRQQ